MFIGHFTERPYQDPNSGYFGATGRSIQDLSISNGEYDPRLGADLYNRYLDERVYAEEMGFDGLMLNEHHSTPFCMGSVVNVEASILARITNRAKIVLLGKLPDTLFVTQQDHLAGRCEASPAEDRISLNAADRALERFGNCENCQHNGSGYVWVEKSSSTCAAATVGQWAVNV